MSTAKADSMADPKATPGADLTAEAVKAALESQCVSASRAYTFNVSLCQEFGRAIIYWSTDANYPVGVNDTVILMEGQTPVRQERVNGRNGGRFDTGHGFGSGLNASYWGTHGQGSTGNWRQLVITPDTGAD